MKIEKARELVSKKLTGYKVEAAPAADVAKRPEPAVEVISPSLRALKQRYFGKQASATTPVSDEAADSGIVMVQREDAEAGPAKAVVFQKGKIVGRQG